MHSQGPEEQEAMTCAIESNARRMCRKYMFALAVRVPTKGMRDQVRKEHV